MLSSATHPVLALSVLVFGFLLGHFYGLHKVVDGLIQAHIVSLRALFEVLDGEIVGISVIVVGKHASTGKAHLALLSGSSEPCEFW
jgi:hypothetical protein